MRILLIHNSYQMRGGEDGVIEQEAELLRMHGHEVTIHLFNNSDIKGPLKKLSTAVTSRHSPSSAAIIQDLVLRVRPDIVHFHNIFPLVTPGGMAAVAKMGVPVVMTVHNYRGVCAGAMLYRNGTNCEACVGSSKLPGILHRCYRNSAIGSLSATNMASALKKVCREYPSHVTLQCLNGFTKDILVRDGYPPASLRIRPNFVFDKGAGPANREKKILYVGRLTDEKGIETLLEAMQSCPNISLDVCGDGPERERLMRYQSPTIRFLGQLGRDEVHRRMKSALVLALPSRWYEGFPLVVIEAMMSGTGVLANRLGGIPEIIAHNVSGHLVEANTAEAWAKSIDLIANDAAQAAQWGLTARQTYEKLYAPNSAYASLEDLYRDAIERARNA